MRRSDDPNAASAASIAAAHPIAVSVAHAIADSVARSNGESVAISISVIHALILAAVMQHWLLVNDVHLDPFVRGPDVYGAGDTTPVLWRMALAAMRQDVPHPSVVVVGGDLLAHDWNGLAHDAGRDPMQAAIATTREIAGGLDAQYPRAQFLPAIGNNDDPCGDYRSETGGAYLRAITEAWAPLAERAGAAPDFTTTFGRGGYYAARLQNGERAIVLNSVFWSFANRTGCQSHTFGAAEDEIAWLQSELSELTNAHRGVVLMHIPPGFDSQTTQALVRNLVAVPFLSGTANRAVLTAFANHRSTIAFAIGAHTHRYDFRVVSGVPMIVGSSISPVYGNNPAFFELDVDARGDLHDVVPFVYDPSLNRFVRKPSFDAYFGVRTLSGDALAELARRIRIDDATRDRWIVAHDAWAVLPRPGGEWWLANACAQTELAGGFTRCARVTFGSVRVAVAAAVMVLVTAVAVILTLLALRRRVNRRA
jgi:hypothetical protein